MRRTCRLSIVGLGALLLATGCLGGGDDEAAPTATATGTPTATQSASQTRRPPTAEPPQPSATPTPLPLANGVSIGGLLYRVLFACTGNPTVGLVTENLLLEAESPTAEHRLVSCQVWFDEGATGYVVQLGVGGEVLEGTPSSLDGATIPNVASGGGSVAASDGEPLEVVHAHQRPSRPCQEVVRHLDAATELGDVTGRWVYGVLQACDLRPADRAIAAELWLTGGGRMFFVTANDGTLLVFAGPDREQWTAGLNTGGTILDGDSFSGDETLTRADSTAPQRVRFDLDLGEVPCRSP